MNRTAAWLTFLVALIGTLVWARFERRERERPMPTNEAAQPSEVERTPAPLAMPVPDPAGASAPEPERSTSAQGETRTEAVTEPLRSARRLPVRVVTRASQARDAERLPGLAFQVFAQRPGIGGAAHVPTDPPLYSGRTDEAGTASFEVDAAFTLALGGLPLLHGRVVEPGYQQISVASRGQDAKGVVELVLHTQRGATARGRVVDEQGEAVEAKVRLFPGGSSLALPATSLADGWFELHFARPVDDGWLLAEASLRGTGTLSALRLVPADPPADLRIVVSGPGVLAGSVRDGDGEPAPGLDLLIQLAELDPRSDGVEPPSSLVRARESEGGGHISRRLETDATGEFEVRGLRRALYVVRSRTGQGNGRYDLLLTPLPVRADGAPIELRLHRPHVLVRLVREEIGLPPSWERPERTGRWPAETRVVLYPCTPAGADPLVTGGGLVGQTDGLNEVLFEVPDGARYLVGACGEGFDGTLQVVEVPAGANRVTVELRPRALDELGAVAVRVVSAGRELGSGDELALALETPAERARLVELADRLPAPPWVLSAPAGVYRLVVEGLPAVETWHGTLVTPRAFGRVESDIELRAGQTQELTLELDAGAWLEVTLTGVPDAADLTAMRDRGSRGELVAWVDPAAPVGATLALEQAGRRPEPVVFGPQPPQRTFSGGYLQYVWPLGATQRSEICPTGRYTLVARLPGGREVRCEVELVAGQTTAVRLEF